jgi:hypothetical protein
MRGRSRESEPVETPPHRAEFWFPSVPGDPLPASGAREAALLGNRSKIQKRHTIMMARQAREGPPAITARRTPWSPMFASSIPKA